MLCIMPGDGQGAMPLGIWKTIASKRGRYELGCEAGVGTHDVEKSMAVIQSRGNNMFRVLVR